MFYLLINNYGRWTWG